MRRVQVAFPNILKRGSYMQNVYLSVRVYLWCMRLCKHLSTTHCRRTTTTTPETDIKAIRNEMPREILELRCGIRPSLSPHRPNSDVEMISMPFLALKSAQGKHITGIGERSSSPSNQARSSKNQQHLLLQPTEPTSLPQAFIALLEQISHEMISTPLGNIVATVEQQTSSPKVACETSL